MHVTRLSIADFRCFESTEIEFCCRGAPATTKLDYPNVNLLLGENAAGKTTLLKAVALALLSPVLAGSGFVPYWLVRRSGLKKSQKTSVATISADVLLHSQDRRASDQSVKLSARVERTNDLERLLPNSESALTWNDFVSDRTAYFVVGYGTSRRIQPTQKFDQTGQNKSRQPHYQRIAGLFEDQYALKPLESWLQGYKRRNPGRYKQVVNLLNRLLPKGTQFTEIMRDGNYLFRQDGIELPLSAMSDGYRAYVGWIGDMLSHICDGAPKGEKLVENYGIVLIDEIDLHLHPSWQLKVVPTLAKALPNVQFILTSHSPIVAGTLQRENIFRLVRDRERGVDQESAVRVAPLSAEIHGLNSDQILLTEAFGLESTRAPLFLEKLEAQATKASAGDLDAALRYTRMLAEGAASEQDDEQHPEAPEWLESSSSKLRQILDPKSKSRTPKRAVPAKKRLAAKRAPKRKVKK